MALSSNIIYEFAKLTKQEKKDNGTEVKGTFKILNGQEYVKIDGSEILTPVTTAVEAVQDERVLVLIKDHEATVTKNITSPAARNKSVQDLKDEVDANGNTIQQMDNTIIQQGNSIIQINNSIDQQNTTINQHETKINQQGDTIISLNNTIIQQGNKIVQQDNVIAQQGDNIDSMNNTIIQHGDNINSMNNVIIQQGNTISQQGNTISQQGNLITEQGNQITSINNDILSTNNKININESNITILNSGFKIVDGVLTGLSDIIVNNLKTETIDSNYAKIDFANIQMAAIQKLFSDSGIIKDLIVEEGHIAGELVGVTIKGDLIEANTLVADKLVVKGENGIYYKLNLEGETIEAEQTTQNSLNGNVITANSITASKIVVEDLVAFGATIAGFIIDTNSIHSTAKSDINSSIQGLYFDKEGQFYLGDDLNHVKYYKNQNGDYILDIRASEIYFGTGNKTVSQALTESTPATFTPLSVPVTFTNIVKGSFSGNTFTRDTGSAWDAGFTSVENFTNGNYVETKVTNLGSNFMLGFNNGTNDSNYTSIDCAVFKSGSSVYAYVNGVSKGKIATVVLNDILRVAIQNGYYSIYLNNDLIYTSNVPAVLPVYVDSSITTPSASISNIVCGTFTPASILAQNNAAVLAASYANANALNAQSLADTANNKLNDLASDNKLTAVEKQQVKTEWDSIVSEVVLNDMQATSFEITTEKTAYDTAYNNLNTYITPLLSNLGTTSDITGTTFRSNFKAYYDARTVLLNAISTKAQTTASNAQNKIDNLKIGGKNLWLNSSFNSGLDRYSQDPNGGTIAIDASNLNGNKILDLSRSGYSGTFRCYIQALDAPTVINYNAGDIFTLSAWVYIDPSIPLDASNNNIIVRGSAGDLPCITINQNDATGKWVKYSNTFIAQADGTFQNGYILLGKNGYIKVSQIKLERDSIATDWTPANEDVDKLVALTVKSIIVEYYLSTSQTILAGGSWSTTAPTWVNGKYMWTKTITTYTNGTTSESSASCIAGAKGDTGSTGATGTSISSIVAQYYLSTSKTTQSGGSWSTTAPTWSSGMYMWTRSQLNYTNPTSTSYTTPVCDSSWEAVNNLQVGGRNVIQYSKMDKDMPRNIVLGTLNDVLTREYLNDARHVVTNATGLNNNAESIEIDISKMENITYGDTITFSVDIKGTINDTTSGTLSIMHSTAANINDYASITNLLTFRSLISSSVYNRYSITFTVPTIDNYYATKQGKFYILLRQGVNGDIYYKNIKLETGNMPSEWSPAPEDIDADITDAKTTADNAQNSADNAQNSVNNLSSSVNEQFSVLTNKSATIESNLDSVNVKIQETNDVVNSQGDEILSLTDRTNELETTVDGITNIMKETGGLNLWKDSVLFFDGESWNGTSFVGYSDTDIINNTKSGNSIYVQNGTISQTLHVKNGIYTNSFVFKKLIPLANVTVKINDVTKTLTGTDWDEDIMTFEVTNRTITVEITSDTDNAAYISDLMLNSGASVQTWGLNQNETYTDTVKIGKGIQISATNADTELDATADGIRINNSITKETVTEFTDKGIDTKNMNSEKALISNLLIQNINGYVCFNNIGL